MTTTSVKGIAAKLLTAMQQIGVVKKSGTNTKQQYKFVKATDVANEVRAALVDAGVAFTYDVEEERTWEKPTASGGMLFFCAIRVRGDFIDKETGEVLSGRTLGWGADSLDKAPYKAMTGALKYLLRMNFLIPDEDDPEQDNKHDDDGPVQPSAPAPQSSRPNGSSRPSGKTITEPQQKRLFALARKANASNDDIKAILLKHGYASSAAIPMSDYERICALFESGQWADGQDGITDDDLPF